LLRRTPYHGRIAHQAMIEFTADTVQLDRLLRHAAAISGNLNGITSHALNSAVKGTHGAMRAELLSRIDRPTSWTTRGLLRRSSTPNDLTAAVGFNYGGGEFSATFAGKGTGTPAGRYMDVQARGGTRLARSSERKLRASGVLDPGQFITPTGKGPSRLNQFGNVRASTYVQILAGMRAGSGPGFNANTAAGSATSARYWFPFAAGYQGEARPPSYSAIAVRSGRKPRGNTGKGTGNPGRPATSMLPRGFTPVFNITRAPSYSVRFPLKKLAMTDFSNRYPIAFRRAVEASLSRR
jgi:hypothetical protein